LNLSLIKAWIRASQPYRMNAQSTGEPVMIDRTRVADGFLFATHGDRCRYLGTSRREKPHWLKQNKGRYRRLDDIEQESLRLAPAVESETKVAVAPAEPNGQTLPRYIERDGDEKDDVALADTLPGDYLPLSQPTSLSTPVKENATDGSTNAELLWPAKAATGEAAGSQTESTPVGTNGRKRGRSDGRQLKKQEPPAGTSKASPKRSPERMRIVLNTLRKIPLLWHAASKAGIHRKTLEYWIRCSAAGHDGYDINWQGIEWKFHEHCESAICEAHQKLEDEILQRALGYDKVLTYRGRVMYKIDQSLVDLGYEGPDAYLKDENGNPVPETVRKVDRKAQRFILARYRPNTWGKRRKIDTPREGGVLIVGDMTKKPKYNTDASVRARTWKSWSKKLREEKE
jgi:hypothetical protein